MEDGEFTTKVFTNDDRSLKLLGELLSNQVSRDIIRLLIEKEMYANEIANKLDIQFSLISHHLKKMGDLGLLSVSEKRIVKKGQTHKFYKINPGIFLLPSHTEDKVSDEGILKKIFKEGIKFASIGIVALGYYLFTKPPAVSDEYLTLASQKEINLTIPLLIILVGVISERIFTEIKKKRKPSFNRK